MLCLRCLHGSLPSITQTARQMPRIAQKSQQIQSRSLNILSSAPTRPTLLPSRPALPASSVESTTLQPTSQPGLTVLQIRGAKRDTYNPSHVVRKRRHGFLSRLRTRTGRMILKRRRLKKRNTLSH